MSDRKSHWEIVPVAILCTIGGFLTGKALAPEAAPADDAHDEGDHAGPVLSATTIENLGVVVGPIERTTFQRPTSIAARIEDTPRTVQPVYAPIGGRVASIEVDPGTVTEAGATVVTILRDPLPRPKLTFTADILRPAQELLHEQVVELRKSSEEVEITRTELARIERFTGEVGGEDLPIIPRERAIDMRYQLLRAEKANELAHHELIKHGLSDEQIEAIQGGAPLPEFDEAMWQRALARNGLWPDEARQLSEALPAELRNLPWVTATIGELAASGLVSDVLIAWLADEAVGECFLDIGVLLQRGHTVEDLQRLHALHALDPVVRIVAPVRDGSPSWDVAQVTAKPGAHVETGDTLLTLRDPRELWLRVDPVGGEVATLLAAVQDGHALQARPLVPDAGPMLEGLQVRSVESSTATGGTTATIAVENSIRSEIEHDGGRSRAWQLRSGLRYVLEVPVQTLDDVFILPATAVAEAGPDRVVFLQDGNDFKPVPIVVAYEDQHVVVVPKSRNVTLFPGDVIALRGAFELGLALTGGDVVDPHAGHSH
jgi:multidrug efflux pump subunit AcrA (membrane-fusion protein)